MAGIKTDFGDRLHEKLFPKAHNGNGKLKYVKAVYGSPSMKKLTKGHDYAKKSS